MWQPAFAALGLDKSQVHTDARLAIVLLHGYLCLSTRAYWRGLWPMHRALAAAGVDVAIASAPICGGVAARAEHLAHYISGLPHGHLVLVGHNMGGLDARYIASRLDPSRRIRSVITIGTPHRGSAVAEWALSKSKWATPLLRLVDRGALRDLTRDGARRLEHTMLDRPDVTYRAIVGRCRPETLAGPFGLLAFPKELPVPPRSWVERAFEVRRWTDMPVGGHFAALEQPGLLAQEVRAFFRPLRLTAL